jgi:site-specific DNA recombinase
MTNSAQIGCVLYARSSKDSHDVAPAAQLKQLRAFAAQRGYRVVAERQDAAISANANPPELAAILQELKNKDRGWTVICAVDSSRIARDMDLAGVISYQIRKAGARLEYSKHPSSDNPAMDMIRDSIMRGFDQYHSMVSKQKGLAGMAQNVESGHRAGGRAPLGYALERQPTGAMRDGQAVTKSHLVLDPAWAPKVKRYLGLRALGRQRPAAARMAGLAEKDATTLIGLERNALVYAGATVWNRHAENGPERYRPRKEWVVKLDTHPALISVKRAEALMAAAMPTARAREPSGDFLLSGFLLTPEGKRLVASGDGYYRHGKGRRIPAAALEAVVLDQINEERDGHEFMQKFIAEAKRAAAAIVAAPKELAADRAALARRLAAWRQIAENAPGSPTVGAQLRELEAEQERIEQALRDAAKNTKVKAWLGDLKPAEARRLLESWYIEDGATVEQRRAALAMLVEKIEFNPATGTGRVFYRLGLNGERFNLGSAARELDSKFGAIEARVAGKNPVARRTASGVSGRPHGDSNPGYRREKAVTQRLRRQRKEALIFSSIPAPGHRSFSPSLLNGTSTVLRCACRSSASGAR